jgi:hypothetical protein
MWWVVAAVVLWFLYQGDGNPIEGALNTLDMIDGRGSKVTNYPADANGLVDTDPQTIADFAGVSVDVMAGARMLASEEPHSDRPTKIAIMWCLINEASRRGQSLSDVLLHAKNPAHNGFFGSQKDKDPTSPNFGKSDRYATTALDAWDEEIAISQGCQDGSIADSTGGATNFDRAAGETHPAKIAADRIASGLVAYNVDGVDPGLRFWGPA